MNPTLREGNKLRYAGAPGHVESFFVRANDRSAARAVWLKVTVFAPLEGPAEVESWLIYFDARRKAPVAGRETSPYRQDFFGTRGDGPSGKVRVTASRMTLELGPSGSARGAVATAAGDVDVELHWLSLDSELAAPLELLTPRILAEGPFPKSKLVTPFPSLRVSGHLVVEGERIDLSEWTGMQGHNWGKVHAFEYAWGQCLFPSGREDEDTMLEGFSARVRVGRLLTPRVSCLVVRRGRRTLRFDRLFDFWRQDATTTQDRWTLRLTGRDGEARLEMDATDRPMVCLGYRNPDRRLSFCFNSKLARVRLRVQPSSGSAFACESEHGGALEFLRDKRDPRYPDVI